MKRRKKTTRGPEAKRKTIREREREREQGAGNWKEGGPDPVWSSVSQTLWP